MPPSRMQLSRFPAFVALGFGLLLAAWVVATQPFQAPDEASHYLRAAGIASGQWLGSKTRYHAPWIPASQRAWAQRNTRAVVIPASLTPPGASCKLRRPQVGSCVEATPVGNYHPLPYILPAAAISVSRDTGTALWLSRAASAAQCLAFLVLAIALLWSGKVWSLIGLLMAVTPMVLFVSSVINPNGLEVAADLAFIAGLLRVSRSPSRVGRWVWVAVAVSGAVTILSWQLGPVFALVDVCVAVALLGRSGLRELAHGTGVRWMGAALVLAALAWLAYGLASGVQHSQFHVSLLHAHGGFTQLLPVLRESVGVFGLESIPISAAARWIWWLLVLGLVVSALRVSPPGDRVLLVAVIAAALMFPILFYSWVYRFSGYTLQGRYTLPLMVLIPLLSGELVSRHIGHRAVARIPRVAPAAAIALIAFLQAYAWWYNAGFQAGAPRRLRFYAHAGWSPPLGWIPWLVIVALGASALLAAALTTALQQPSRSRVARFA